MRSVRPDLFDLSGRWAVVTGANKGIGAAMAIALAQAGADIVGVSASMAATGDATRRAINDLGREFEAVGLDLGDRRAVRRFGEEIARRRDIDILVNNAGMIRRKPAVEHSDEDFDAVLSVDLSAQFSLAREIGAAMLRRGHGKIVFTASLLSFQGGINVPGYAAAKSGIAGLTRALANEWASHGINVNAIAPGYITTDNTAALRRDGSRFENITRRIPAGRWGEPNDLAGATVFLASSASDYVHGVVLPVDGGWLAR